MKAECKMHDDTHTETWRVELTDAPEVPFGYAGRLVPTIAWVTRTTRAIQATAARTIVGLEMRMEAPNRNNPTFNMRGRWGAPKATEGDPHEHGHDGHGHIDDLPAELVEAILAACGGITIPKETDR